MLSKEDAKMILTQYSLLGRQCFIDVVYKLKRFNRIVLNEPLFQNPITYDILYPILQNDPDYRETTYDEVVEK